MYACKHSCILQQEQRAIWPSSELIHFILVPALILNIILLQAIWPSSEQHPHPLNQSWTIIFIQAFCMALVPRDAIRKQRSTNVFAIFRERTRLT